MLCYSVLYSKQLLVKAGDQLLPLFNNVKGYTIYLCKIKNRCIAFKLNCFILCRTTVEQLQNEINTLDTRIKKIRKQIELPSTEKEIKAQMIDFLQVSN